MKRDLVELAFEHRRPVSEEIRVALKKHIADQSASREGARI
jgi:hypothetical protein